MPWLMAPAGPYFLICKMRKKAMTPLFLFFKMNGNVFRPSFLFAADKFITHQTDSVKPNLPLLRRFFASAKSKFGKVLPLCGIA
jgi:hypothetical protein